MKLGKIKTLFVRENSQWKTPKMEFEYIKDGSSVLYPCSQKDSCSCTTINFNDSMEKILKEVENDCREKVGVPLLK